MLCPSLAFLKVPVRGGIPWRGATPNATGAGAGGAGAEPLAFLGPWPASRRVAVAVSGGADSMALAWLARRWGDPLALIVDHRLRPDSTSEALLTAARLSAFGVRSRVLTLQGLCQGPGLAARARAARYAALASAMREAGLLDLLLGHHAGDQAETFLIRDAARSGPLGLACMAPVVALPGLRLVRPLLRTAPALLRDLLRAEGISWVEDPGNQSPLAGRTAARRCLADDDGPGTESVLSRVQAAGLARIEADRGLARCLAERASIFPEGYAVLTPGPAEPALLAALIRGLTGAAYPERGAALERLAAGTLRGTLGGVRFMPAGRHGPGTLLVREAAAMALPVPATIGGMWDGRFRLDRGEPLPASLEVGALGEDAAAFRDRAGLATVILRSLPALRDGKHLVAVPHLGYFREWTNRSLRLSFCPSTPVSGAPFEVPPLGDAQTAQAHHVLLDTGVAPPKDAGRTTVKY